MPKYLTQPKSRLGGWLEERGLDAAEARLQAHGVLFLDEVRWLLVHARPPCPLLLNVSAPRCPGLRRPATLRSCSRWRWRTST